VSSHDLVGKENKLRTEKPKKKLPLFAWGPPRIAGLIDASNSVYFLNFGKPISAVIQDKVLRLAAVRTSYFNNLISHFPKRNVQT